MVARNRCRAGHEYTPENTYLWKTGRVCRICYSARLKRYDLKRPDHKLRASEAMKRWHLNHLDHVRDYRREWMRHKRGSHQRWLYLAIRDTGRNAEIPFALSW